MAAWLSKAVHREMRAAARDGFFVKAVVFVVIWLGPLVKQGNFFTPSAPRFNSEHHESPATAPDEFRVGPFLPPPWVCKSMDSD